MVDGRNQNIGNDNIIPNINLSSSSVSSSAVDGRISQGSGHTPLILSVNHQSPLPAPVQSLIPNENKNQQIQFEKKDQSNMINLSSSPILPKNYLTPDQSDKDNVMSFSELIFENKLNTILDKMQKLEEENQKLKPLLKTIVDMQFYTFQNIKDYQKTINELTSSKGILILHLIYFNEKMNLYFYFIGQSSRFNDELSPRLAQKTSNLRKSLGFKEIRSEIKDGGKSIKSHKYLDLDDDDFFSLLEGKEKVIEKKEVKTPSKISSEKIISKNSKTSSKLDDVFLEP